jgi:co-chaperonin GroES (HSP10)
MRIADLIVPLRDDLLVRVDPATEKVGEIWRPDTAAPGPSVIGQVLAVGPDQEYYRGGERVVLSQFAGTSLALEGVSVEDRVKVVHPQHVLAILADDADLDRLGPPLGAFSPPWHLLVERCEMPLQRGRIHIPANSRTQVRAHEATVFSVGEGVAGFKLGESVLLTTMVAGRSVAFGPRGERTLWLVTPGQVLAKLREELPDGRSLFNEGEHSMQHWQEAPVLTQAVPAEPALDEGDPRGLR